jgi:capsular exopolysaccharide synthesis family protein
MLGAGLALLKDQLDHRLRSSEEMAAVLDAPILGVLPHMRDAKDISLAGRRVHLSPDSISAEAYRTIRTAVEFNAAGAKSLLLTSPTGNDGKTTVTCNLAIAMAQVGKRVLIIDADLRRPSQHEVWQFKRPAPGQRGTLGEALAGKRAVDDLIFPSGVENLDVLPCFKGVENPAEMINSPQFAQLLAGLTGRYDRVIVDSPPTMPVADSRILGALCDATIVVLRADKSARKVTELTRDGLRGVGIEILGGIVNDVPRRKGGQGYYGYYGYSSYYRYDNRYDRQDDDLAEPTDRKPPKTGKKHRESPSSTA